MGNSQGWIVALLVGLPVAFILGLVIARMYFTSSASTQSVSNTEEWEVIKDPETGRVKGVRVHRKVERR